ncbi:MAG: hypothetical protein V4457_01920 [Pseudomonadota bacterium]
MAALFAALTVAARKAAYPTTRRRLDPISIPAEASLTPADTLWFADRVDRVEANHTFLVGGLGQYPATAYHESFVHIDRRDFKARC